MEQINITFYTDPICCWSWVLEKPLTRIVEENSGNVSVRYVIYPMITTWDSYHDPLNAVTTPVQMGPVWMHASAISGVPLNDRIWTLDPPSSSVPAALAVKCAYLQTDAAGKLYLDAVREAMMTDGRNVAKRDVLLDIAKAVEQDHPDVFNAEMFFHQLGGPLPLAALRKDMDETSINKIGRFPTLIIRSAAGKGVLISGYRPYDVLAEAVQAAVDTKKIFSGV